MTPPTDAPSPPAPTLGCPACGHAASRLFLLAGAAVGLVACPGCAELQRDVRALLAW